MTFLEIGRVMITKNKIYGTILVIILLVAFLFIINYGTQKQKLYIGEIELNIKSDIKIKIFRKVLYDDWNYYQFEYFKNNNLIYKDDFLYVDDFNKQLEINDFKVMMCNDSKVLYVEFEIRGTEPLLIFKQDTLYSKEYLHYTNTKNDMIYQIELAKFKKCYNNSHSTAKYKPRKKQK